VILGLFPSSTVGSDVRLGIALMWEDGCIEIDGLADWLGKEEGVCEGSLLG